MEGQIVSGLENIFFKKALLLLWGIMGGGDSFSIPIPRLAGGNCMCVGGGGGMRRRLLFFYLTHHLKSD